MAEAKALRKELRLTKSLLMQAELKRMRRVLRRMGHTNTENVVQLKVCVTRGLQPGVSTCLLAA